MNLTRTAINRPIFIFMLMIAAFLMGFICYNSMRKELNPDVSFGTITVSTTYPGASPDDINQLISKKIEDAVSGVAGVREVTSTSQEGLSVVVLQLELGTDLDASMNDVRSKVDQVAPSLPKDALKPEVGKFDTTTSPVLTLSVSSSNLSSKELRDLIDDKISDRFAQIPGVVQVGVSGGDVREIQVALSKDKLLEYGLGIEQVQQALAAASINVPAGHLVSGPQDYTVRVIGQFETPEQVANMIISINDPRSFNGRASNVHLSDIATITDASQERTDYARLNGQDTIAIALEKAKDGDSVTIKKAADDLMASLSTEFKQDGLSFTATYDEAKQITESLQDLQFALTFGVVLVSLIVFIFLHNLRGTLIVAAAIPTCIFCSFIGMKVLGFTINSMTMLSLQLAIGVLVDDAIVVLENIYRHLRMGEDPRDAALNGRGEIGLAALAITMADVVVFLPIGFMGGIVGAFFKPMALGFVCAVLFSLFISFTLTPLLAARWYKAGEDMEHPTGRFANWFERRFHSLELHYRNSLEWALNHRWFVYITGNLALVAVIMFIAGSFAADKKGALTTGFMLVPVAVAIGFVVFACNVFSIDWTLLRDNSPRKITFMGILKAVGFLVLLGLMLGAPGLAFKIFPAIIVLSIVGTFLGRVARGQAQLWRRSSMNPGLFFGLMFKYVGSALLFGLVFPIVALGGKAFADWKQAPVLQFQFLPDSDQGQVNADIQLAPGTSLAETQKVVSYVESKFKTDPDMKYYLSTVGEQGAGGFNTAGSGTNFAEVSGTLYDKKSFMDSMPWARPTEKTRTRSDKTVAADLTEKIGRVPGAQISIGSNSNGFGSAIQLSFLSDDHDLLLSTVQKIQDALANGAIKGVINPLLTTNAGKPELQIKPKREELADAGLTPDTLGNAVRILYQGDDNTKLRHNGREYGIRVMMDYADRDNMEAMNQVPITFNQGNPIFLPSVATVSQAPGVDRISRRDRSETIGINADLLPGFAAGTVSQQIGDWIAKSNMLPAGVTFKQGGQADAQNREMGFILGAFGLGIILVYMLLASLYDNLLYPLIIMVSEPQAMVGALLGLIVTNKDFNLIGIIGVIALVGLVGKNAILLVDYTNTLRDRGRSRHDALVEAGPTRLRPILMTTMALILGMLPVALAIGRGSEFRETIGITIIGGISLSTILTLLVIPCSYTIFDDITIAFARMTGKKPQHMGSGQDELTIFDEPTPSLPMP
jgi:HAE1 family hydrophobic/amphiphilic exporter-1